MTNAETERQRLMSQDDDQDQGYYGSRAYLSGVVRFKDGSRLVWVDSPVPGWYPTSEPE